MLLRPWLLLRASSGRFVRLPTFWNCLAMGRFQKKPGSAPRIGVVGRAGRRSEWATGVVLTANLSLHGFGRNIDDLIDVVRDGPTLRARNVGQATSAGVELSGAANLRELLRVELHFPRQPRSDDTAGPKRQLAARTTPARGVLRSEAAYRPLRFLRTGLRQFAVLDPANLVERPARTLHAIGWALGPITRFRVSLRVEVRNLLDTRTVDMALPLSPSRARCH